MKLFCAEVSDITMQEYKAALHRQQKIEKEEDDSSTEESRTVKRTRRKRVVKKRQPKKEKKVVKKRQPKKKKKVVSAVHADTVRSSQEVSSKKTDDDMTIEEIISSLTPLCGDEMQVVRRISNESQTITQESSKARADLPTSVGQLSLPIPSYYHSYPISTGSSLADVADVDDEDIWNMWMSCN